MHHHAQLVLFFFFFFSSFLNVEKYVFVSGIQEIPGQALWHPPAVLATWEAEAGGLLKSKVLGQSG
jgi:hypothetical protein